MSTSTPEQHTFQAEVKQLLDIVIHSVYTDKEIFIRELISNASDALEKLRHIQYGNDEIFDDNLPLEINVHTDDNAGTLTIQDFGVGLTREELNENLGTIAHSGTKSFLQAIEDGQKPTESLIGQFGLGFYSAFMVADDVKVYTHSWKPDAEHLVWASDGSGSYTIEDTEGQRRGCKIVLKLKEEAKEFGQEERVKNVLKRYSSFVRFPINVNGEKLNTVQAIWLKNKSEISEEEYTEFYKYIANAVDEPIYRLHFNADAPISINALLYVSGQNTERFGFGRMEPGVSVYSKNVLIESNPQDFLPEWLRFLRGVIDSADLPLSISRERMQDSSLLQKISRLITKRILKMLNEQSRKDPEKYDQFYQQFASFLKEGVAVDHQHREELAKLLRYESSHTDAGTKTSLDDYVSRMREEQKEIYYIHAGSREAIENGPYLEAFKERGIEVLYVYDSIDEFVMTHLGEYDGKKLVAGDQADLELGQLDSDKASDETPLEENELNDLSRWMRDVLGERVGEIKSGDRLVESPVVALSSDKMNSPAMRRIMKAMQQDTQQEMPLRMDLEINPRHSLIKQLNQLRQSDEAKAKIITEQLADNAFLAAGLVEDPRTMVKRLNDILYMATNPSS